MTTISVKKFSGEIPRSPVHLLPDSNAAVAINCNFAYGELRPLKGGFALNSLANAAKSIFTLDGLTFFSWPVKTKAWKGPVTGDIFNRMYYANSSDGFRVAYTTDTKINGGTPGTSYKVGVPRPEAPLSYALIDLNTLPEYPNATVKLYSYYEANGKRYDEKAIDTYSTVKPFREFSFTIAPPAVTVSSTETSAGVALASFSYMMDGGESIQVPVTVDTAGATVTLVDGDTLLYNGMQYDGVYSITPVSGTPQSPGTLLNTAATQTSAGTPDTATPAVRIDVVDSVKNTTIFTLSASSGLASSRSDAIPGGVDATLVKNGTAENAWRLVLNYGVMETRAYVATLINQHNEESQPCDPIFASPTYLQVVSLTLTKPNTTGYVPVNRCRFYRSVAGEYLSCTPEPVSFPGQATIFLDVLLNIVDTDAVLETQRWGLPPNNLTNLTLAPNGFFLGSVGDTLYMSEPYAPWAWPYAMSFPFPIIGIRPTENGVVVTTNSYPYLVTGVHPAAMTQMVLSSAQAGISDRGMCNLGNAVAFVSHDGIVVVNNGTVDVESFQKLFTREVWRERYGSVLDTLELSYHDGALVGACPTAGKCFELRLDENAGAFTEYDASFRADALTVLPATDQLYYVNGSQLLQYRGGSALTYTWTSRDWILPKPTNFGAGYINVVDGTVTLTVYADGLVWHAQEFTQAGYFRLPSGSKALRWSFQLHGTGTVREVSLAERMEELRRV